MDVTGHVKNDKKDETDTLGRSKGSPGPSAAAQQPDEATAETHVNLVSPFAHPRGARVSTFDLRQFVTRHSIPLALSCLALGGAVAAVILKRRRRDSWDARVDRLRQTL